MEVTNTQIDSIVDRVVNKLLTESLVKKAQPSANPEKEPNLVTNNKPELKILQQTSSQVPSLSFSSRPKGCFNQIEDAIEAAEKAYWHFKSVSIEQRKRILSAIRSFCREKIKEISRLAVEETGLGRLEDKLIKNELAIEKTPGVEDLMPTTFTGDYGLTLLERAPFGLIGSITPCTNPTETIISNGIGMIAGGNSVVFNPHPAAKNVSVFTIDLMNQAVLSEGGPPNLFTTVSNPTIVSANVLMKHHKVALLVVTGGPAVVKAAMQSGKRVVAAGPGNPPVVVDETADPEKAAKDIVTSASSDNNIICVVEKEIIVTEAAADALKKALLRNRAVELSPYQTRRLEQIIVDNGHPNKDWVGKDIQLILRQIGLEVDNTVRIAFTETGPDHPFARIELLMPILPFIRARDFERALEIAHELEGGRYHTSVIHSKNIDRMHQMHIRMNTSIFVKNGMALAGLGYRGEGPASFTIASPTGEGVTTARHFTRLRRCIISEHFGVV